MSKCKWCGGEFEPADTHQIYCGNRCYKDANNAQAVKRYVEKNGELGPKECMHCGGSFSPKRRDTRFCSKLCNAHYLRDNPTDFVSDPDKYQVTTPYGSHSFDWWVKVALEGGSAVSHV